MQAAAEAGYGGGSHADILSATRLPKGAVDYFVELHIEQGPLLEQKEVNIGVVSAIAAPAALEVRFSGDGGHAGALLMPYR
jgi:ureidoglycolate amidohydrolase